jgi:acyl-CoA thioesterase-1
VISTKHALPLLLTVLALGDSLTEGYGLAKDDAYPALLEKRIHAEGRKDVSVLNAGVSGSTSASAVSRLRWHLKTKPQVVILALGANDMLRGMNPAETEKNLAAAIELAQSANARVLLVGMRAAPNYGPDYVARFEKIYPALAKRYHVPLVPFLLEGVAGKGSMNQADGIHPNPAGQKQLAATLFPAVWTLL